MFEKKNLFFDTRKKGCFHKDPLSEKRANAYKREAAATRELEREKKKCHTTVTITMECVCVCSAQFLNYTVSHSCRQEIL